MTTASRRASLSLCGEVRRGQEVHLRRNGGSFSTRRKRWCYQRDTSSLISVRTRLNLAEPPRRTKSDRDRYGQSGILSLIARPIIATGSTVSRSCGLRLRLVAFMRASLATHRHEPAGCRQQTATRRCTSGTRCCNGWSPLDPRPRGQCPPSLFESRGRTPRLSSYPPVRLPEAGSAGRPKQGRR